MKITIDTIPHKDQRYDTVGDWTFEGRPDLKILVSELGDWKKEALVAVHELVEALLCMSRGIPVLEVDDFDMNHPELEEPGLDEKAPYHWEHMAADIVERFMAKELRMSWKEHEETLKNVE